MLSTQDSHNPLFGYLLWAFGFTGAHRFYYGRPISGTLYFLTFGLLGVGWIVDLFLIPSLASEAQHRYRPGPVNYDVTWALLSFLGLLGAHRFYMGKWLSGALYVVTGGLFGIGVLYDYWTLNEQLDTLPRV